MQYFRTKYRTFSAIYQLAYDAKGLCVKQQSFTGLAYSAGWSIRGSLPGFIRLLRNYQKTR